VPRGLQDQCRWQSVGIAVGLNCGCSVGVQVSGRFRHVAGFGVSVSGVQREGRRCGEEHGEGWGWEFEWLSVVFGGGDEAVSVVHEQKIKCYCCKCREYKDIETYFVLQGANFATVENDYLTFRGWNCFTKDKTTFYVCPKHEFEQKIIIDGIVEG